MGIIWVYKLEACIYKNGPCFRHGPFLYIALVSLERSVVRGTGEGDDVADVLHTRDKEEQALKAKAEAGVRA